MIRYIRSLLIAARNLPVITGSEWTKEDQELLTRFLSTKTGNNFKGVLASMTIQAQNSAITRTNTLQHSCGYASGFRGAVSAIESLCSMTLSKSEEVPDSDSDLAYLNP